MPAAADVCVEYLDVVLSPETALAALPEPVACWFRSRFGLPTVAQRLAWPALAAGRHLLLSAPTGTGKTLAAFLPLLGPLLHAPLSAWPAASASLAGLYVAPLKALNNDTRRNLDASLDELSAQSPGIRRPRIAV